MAHLSEAKRIIIKVGSLLLIDEASGTVNQGWLESLATDLAMLQRAGKEIIIVSSGAVALGRPRLGFTHPDLKLQEKQAAAACGQIALAEAWRHALQHHGIQVAQMLITAEDTEDRRRYLNARSTLNTLIGYGVIAVINENDSVTTAEIRYGDNDRLAARVAAMSSADLLILFSDIDGLYTADPKRHADAKLIEQVEDIDATIWAMAGDTLDHRSTGGMKTKLMAADIATSSGCHMVIAPGKVMHPVDALLQGGHCTWFLAKNDPMNARKHWIANSVHVAGTLRIDEGAKRALLKGTSLLPAGITAVAGDFARGDTVRILGPEGEEIARGLAAYPATAAQMIMGQQSEAIERILGFKGRDEMVHRDDLVMTG